jgi:hypothetical protein
MNHHATRSIPATTPPGLAGVGRVSGHDGAAPAEGLVTSATTRRENLHHPKAAGQKLAFPTPELVAAAAGQFSHRPGWNGHEGPRPVLSIAPGVVAVGWPDIARRERTAERAAETAHKMAEALGRYWAEYVGDPAEMEPTRTVTAWSSKSRSRMVRTLAELDYTPLLRMDLALPMTTLTYPGDWLPVAPTGKAVKEHMDKWRKAFARAWGFSFAGIWKLEFQRRGAPHIHLWGAQPLGEAGDKRRIQHAADMLTWEAAYAEWKSNDYPGEMAAWELAHAAWKGADKAERGPKPRKPSGPRKPYFRPAVGDGMEYRAWLSVVWADVVAHPDPEQRRRHQLAGTAVDIREGERMRDPKRLAVYFTKHGAYRAKEYQHEVPKEWQEPGAGPGRFWGYWKLEKAVHGVELTPADAVFAARTLRRLARSKGVTRVVMAPRVNTRTGEIRYRPQRRRATRLGNGTGYLCVNDGPAVAAALARALERQGQDAETARQAELKAERVADRKRLAASERRRKAAAGE